jgi:hypothetical protein
MGSREVEAVRTEDRLEYEWIFRSAYPSRWSKAPSAKRQSLRKDARCLVVSGLY